jgi:hypothetical protein
MATNPAVPMPTTPISSGTLSIDSSTAASVRRTSCDHCPNSGRPIHSDHSAVL